jgi:hypothetical protein
MSNELSDTLSELLNLLKKARSTNPSLPVESSSKDEKAVGNEVKTKRAYHRRNPEQFSQARAANKLSLAISRTEKSVERVERGLSILPTYEEQLNLFPHLKPKLDPRLHRLQQKRKRWVDDAVEEDVDPPAPSVVANRQPSPDRSSLASAVVVQVQSPETAASMDTSLDVPTPSVLRVAELSHPAGESQAPAQVRAAQTKGVQQLFSSLNFKL